MDEKNLENINKIDLDFSGADDGDDSFAAIIDTQTDATNTVPVKTGIILNFDDEDADFNANMKKHSSAKPFEFMDSAKVITPTDSVKGYNEIDMECKYGDEDDDEHISEKPQAKRHSLFDDDEDDFDSKELALEEDITPKPNHKVSVEAIEDDFWKKVSNKYDNNKKSELEKEVVQVKEEKQANLKNLLRDLQKKHMKSNKKGAAGTHFHFAGNPELGRQMFNAGVGSQSDSFEAISGGAGSGSFIGGGMGGGEMSAGNGASAGGGMGEALNTSDFNRTLREVFDTIGFAVSKNDDKTLVAKDLFNDKNVIKAKNIEDLIYALQPFIDSCIIIPLSLATKETFTSYQDWSNWYTDENKARFPKQAAEIKYCDLLANHIKECDF